MWHTVSYYFMPTNDPHPIVLHYSCSFLFFTNTNAGDACRNSLYISNNGASKKNESIGSPSATVGCAPVPYHEH